ncbi:MAG TPA: ABC transporter substrate-binding protein [Streptosporangiaceae bacterium]|jgi:NitT/TauT family transport system substrate-binding protein
MRLDPAGNLLPKRSRRAVRARHLLAAASGLAVLGAAGCAGSATAGGTVSGTITIATVPGVDNAPVYLAKKEGLFAAAGLKNVVIKSYTSQSAELTALQGGHADIAASDYGNLFYQQSQSHDLRILADGYDAGPGVLEVLTLPTTGPGSIQSPVDLANQTIGLPADSVLPALQGSGTGSPISLDAAAATQVLTNYLGNNAGSVKWKSLSQQAEVKQLEQGKLKAILVGEPYIYEAESQAGATVVLDACSGSTASLPLAGYAAMSPWVKDNQAAVADFQQAIARAQSDASLTGQVQQLLPSATGMSVQDADLITIGSYPTTTSILSLERVVRLMSNFNMIALGHAPNVPPMVVHG